MERSIDFAELVELIWAGRFKIAVSIICMTAVGVISAVVMAPRYRASELIEIRVSHQQMSGLSSLARNLGGLAAFAGSSLGGTGNARSVALATLKSRYVIENFIAAHKLLPVLFPDKWDAKKGTWWATNANKVPNNQDGYHFFKKKIFSVSDVGTTGLIRLVVEWRNPAQAASWLTDIVNETNERLQKRQVSKFKADIRYLSKTAQTVMAVQVKKSLYSLMALEYRKLMVAQNPEDAAIQVVDPVVVPRRPESRLLLLVILGTGGGFALGLLYVLIENSVKTRRKRIDVSKDEKKDEKKELTLRS